MAAAPLAQGEALAFEDADKTASQMFGTHGLLQPPTVFEMHGLGHDGAVMLDQDACLL